LIVVLCLIILTSVIASYFLLREERISDEELPKGRKSLRKTRYGIPANDAKLQQRLWHPIRFFFTRAVSINDLSLLSLLIKQQNKVREGLPVQLLDDLQPQAPQFMQINRMTSPDSMLTGSTSYGSNIRSLASPISASSIRFDTPSVRVSLSPEWDRFPPSPGASPVQMHTHLSTPPLSAPSSPTIPQTRSGLSVPANTSTISTSNPYERDVPFRTKTSSGPTTFEGGSRFLETF
jgi:hypothetical protein